ncbi:MAG: exo-alpha-sialidase [Pedosphaera sp.]|nr:exo-alpha-sialidase [Pedosphaera sp.]
MRPTMNILSTTVLSGLLCFGAAVPAAEPAVDFRVDAFVGQQDGYHTYRIPVMVVTGKGTVLLFAEGRKNGRGDGGDIDQIMKRSEDGGKTWSKHVIIHEEGDKAPIRAGNPVAIVERDGKTVHLLFTVMGSPTGSGLYHTKSTDDGLTWSPMVVTSDVPTDKAYSDKNFLKGFGGSPLGIAVGPANGIHTSKGRLVVPCGVSRKVDGKPAGGDSIIYSDDGGKIWQTGGLIPPTTDFSVGEPTVVEKSDGSLMMNMRAGGPDGAYGLGHRVTSTSSDGGLTWSKPVADKNLPCPACQASILRLNEKEILFLNPAVSQPGGFNRGSRRNLTLRLSGDDGATWPHSLMLNEGLAGYSGMAVTKEGKILCVFENGAKDYCEKISVVHVDRAVLGTKQIAQAGKPAGEVVSKPPANRNPDSVVIGDEAAERKHGFKSEGNVQSGTFNDKVWRHARDGGWFSYDLEVLSDQPATLVCTYWGSDRRRAFDILVDGQKIATQTVNRNQPGDFFDVEYKIPVELTRNKEKVTVKFQAEPNGVAGGVFGCVMKKVQ